MNGFLDILEKRYESFMSQKRDWNFFVGLYDYIKFYKEKFGWEDIEGLAKKKVNCIYTEIDDDGLEVELVRVKDIASIDCNEVLGSLYALDQLIVAMENRNRVDKDFSYPAIEEWVKELDLIYSDGMVMDSDYLFDARFFSSSNHEGIANFSRDSYTLYATRVHLFLLEEFSVEKEEGKKVFSITNLSYDSEKGVLGFMGKEVKFNKNTKQYELLKVIFIDINRDWQFSEIMEEIDLLDDNWKSLYDVSDAVKKKVATETGIKDLFLTTTKTVMINVKYRK